MFVSPKSALRTLAVASIALMPFAASAQDAGQPAPGQQQQQAQPQAARGFVGIVPALTAETVGAPAELVVQGVAPNSPAYLAGILRGDRIVAVGGESVEGRSLQEVAEAIRGDVGSAVTLTLERDGQTRDVELTRVAQPRGDHGGHRKSRR